MSTVPTNPADCDRTTVYTGECRNFADTEWIRFASGRRRSPRNLETPWLVDCGTGSFWMADDKVRNLMPLVPAPTGGQWTRDDLPRIGTPDPAHDSVVDGVLDTVVHWLNKHYPKPDQERADLFGAGIEMKRRAIRYKRERDEARAEVSRVAREMARRVAAQRSDYRDASSQHQWLTLQRDDARRARDAAVERAEQAERDLGELRRKVNAWGREQPVPAVSRADVAEALGRCLNPEMWNVTFPSVVNEMCDLFGVEAEQAVDPVEAKARELHDEAYGDEYEFDEATVSVQDALRRLARHQVEQEATR